MRLPDIALLDEPSLARPEAPDEARKIGASLAYRGAQVEVTTRIDAPQAVRYGLDPKPGIDPGKVERAIDSVRLAVGREVAYAGIADGLMWLDVTRPDGARAAVRLSELLDASPALVRLGFPVGESFGSVATARLAELPHLLVAGTTGSGKSVFVNAVLVSLLMRNAPRDLRLVLIDPKRVELAPYAALPHLDRPIVTDMDEAAQALSDACVEMERRYDLFAAAGVRDLASYNDTADERLPRVVVVVDELADLLMTNKEAEDHIVRLGQKARAAGIHLVLATQKPSADVVTKRISANVPARAVFRVAAHTDSKVALGHVGAERLGGRGDGLFLDPTSSPHPYRFQAAWVTDEEVARVVAHWVREYAPRADAARAEAEMARRAEEEMREHEDAAREARDAERARIDAEARALLRSATDPERAPAGLTPEQEDDFWFCLPTRRERELEELMAQRVAERALELLNAKIAESLENGA